MVKTIGLIGGMSWESSIVYYRIINETTKSRLGGLHSAKSVIYSVDFAELEPLQHQRRWNDASAILVDAAQRVERAGADFIVLCTNTMHKLADDIQNSVQIPLLHIADATAEEIKARGFKKVALLGTRFTMEEDFYKGRLIDRHGLEVLVPSHDEMESIHSIIYNELCLGKVNQSSKEKYADIIRRLVSSGAEAVILGCTEIGSLVREEDSPIPIFDTTKIHAEAAVKYALE